MKFNAKRFENALQEAGLNRSELSELMGAHRNTVSIWIRGKTLPRVDMLADALAAMGWSKEKIANQRIGDWYHENGSSPQDDESPAA